MSVVLTFLNFAFEPKTIGTDATAPDGYELIATAQWLGKPDDKWLDRIHTAFSCPTDSASAAERARCLAVLEDMQRRMESAVAKTTLKCAIKELREMK